jgi:hypothetical protein
MSYHLSTGDVIIETNRPPPIVNPIVQCAPGQVWTSTSGCRDKEPIDYAIMGGAILLIGSLIALSFYRASKGISDTYVVGDRYGYGGYGYGRGYGDNVIIET